MRKRHGPNVSTDQERIRLYYSAFDEWGRLDAAEGQLEYERSLALLDRHLTSPSRILDLGGGPGRYSAELANRGHRVVLADLSPAALETARQKLGQLGLSGNLESIDEVNALNLDRYADSSFDAVVAFGPFYHLVAESERRQAAREILRVLQPGGLIFAAFIPRVSGVVGLLERAANRPDQVTAETLREAATTGVFHNSSPRGFQEGYYPQLKEVDQLLVTTGFEVVDLVSLRGIADRLAGKMQAMDDGVRREALKLVDEWSREPAVIATGGHAVAIARRPRTA
jgi:S-adenosylmethionine-dependent methyltransferase